MTIRDLEKQYVRVEVIAKLFGFDGVRRVQQLTQDGVVESVEVKEGGRKARRYELIPTIQSYISFLKGKANGQDLKNKEQEKLQADIDIKKAKAKMAEIQLAELEGTMHRAEDVEDMTTDLCLVIRSALLALPGRMAMDLADIDDPAEISSMIKDEVCAILDELSAYVYNPAEYARRVRERQGYGEKDDEEKNEEF